MQVQVQYTVRGFDAIFDDFLSVKDTSEDTVVEAVNKLLAEDGLTTEEGSPSTVREIVKVILL